ncbi:hypothetical protein FS842_000253 [Serendipita sp. 407]|nr:hypothetical protein FS842_000253 [Serendipita sp. 407]
MLALCPNDRALAVGSNCRQLDFTLRFEQAILFIFTDAFFIVVTLLRLRQLWSQSTKVANPFSLVTILKGIFGLLLLASSCTTLAIHTRTTEVRNITNLVLPSLSVQLVASVSYIWAYSFKIDY